MNSSTFEKLMLVYDMLDDDISKTIFSGRIFLQHSVDERKNYKKEYEYLFENYEKCRIPFISDRIGEGAKLAIAGAGDKGRYLLKMCIHAGYDVACVIDNDTNKQGKSIGTIPIMSYSDFCNDSRNMFVLIANDIYGGEFYKKLIRMGFDEKKIIYYPLDIPTAFFGWEYFDVPSHKKGKREIFVDAGCFDGATSGDFVRWCSGEYSKIYAFEPMQENYLRLQEKLMGRDDVKLFPYAVGEKEGNVKFIDCISYPAASRIDTENISRSDCQDVKVVSIDEIVKTDPVSFIKMDIEGYELEALRGAKNTIVNNKPILAISAYHRERDLIDLPLYINSLGLDYKLCLRHYSNTNCSVVLYAV